MAIDTHFTEEDWERVEHDWTAWWAGDLARPLVMIQNSHERASLEWSQSFLLESRTDAVLDYYQARLEATRCYGDAWPKWWPNLGPGIVAGFLGATVHCDPDFETVWFEPAQEVGIKDLRLAFNSENMWWRRVRELTTAAVERWGGSVAVAHTDLGGNLDILASLRTTEGLLLDLIDAPDEVAWLIGEITRLWLRYYDELYAIIEMAGRGTTPWAAIWSSGRCYML